MRSEKCSYRKVYPERRVRVTKDVQIEKTTSTTRERVYLFTDWSRGEASTSNWTPILRQTHGPNWLTTSSEGNDIVGVRQDSPVRVDSPGR